MKAQYTPGPWIAKKGAGWYITRPEAHARREAAFVVGVHPSVSLVDAPSNDEAEAEANARLIAAAPDMLDVLESVLSRWDKHDDDDAPALGHALRATIAKARGEV